MNDPSLESYDVLLYMCKKNLDLALFFLLTSAFFPSNLRKIVCVTSQSVIIKKIIGMCLEYIGTCPDQVLCRLKHFSPDSDQWNRCLQTHIFADHCTVGISLVYMTLGHNLDDDWYLFFWYLQSRIQILSNEASYNLNGWVVQKIRPKTWSLLFSGEIDDLITEKGLT